MFCAISARNGYPGIFIASNWTDGRVLFTSLEYIVILSIIVCAGRHRHGCTSVECPHRTYDIRVLRFSWKHVFWT